MEINFKAKTKLINDMKWFKFITCGILLVFASCTKNQSITYPDFDYTTVYFASQYPIRTIELGEDLNVDNTLDNKHKINIEATIGGTRANKNQVLVDYTVVDTLCNNFYFEKNGSEILPMPSSYYKLVTKQISIAPGNILGGVQVEFTDAFFADPLAIKNTYAIPLVLTKAMGVDSILRGNSPLENPDRRNGSEWTIPPKDYVLYMVKYVNPWNGHYLRRGKDVITYAGDEQTTELIRHQTYVEKDEINNLTTKSLSEAEFPVTFKDKNGSNVTIDLILKFDDQNNCTISSATTGVTASGTGAFVKKGDKNSWGNSDRDVLYLNYDVSMAQLSAQTSDTLVVRDRGVSPEYYNPIISYN